MLLGKFDRKPVLGINDSTPSEIKCISFKFAPVRCGLTNIPMSCDLLT